VGGQGPTLHIIKSEHDHLFGGCAFEKYPNKHNEDKKDDKAFLFQLYPNQVMLKNTLNASHRAIRCDYESLSVFGNGRDLRIYELNDGKKKSYVSYDGNTYELPPGCNKE
jgi:hypothetical protein